MLRWKGRSLAASVADSLAASCNCCTEPLAAAAVNRRRFVAGVAAGIAASGVAPKAFAQAKPHRIDVHHHVSPPAWNTVLRRENAGQPPSYNWSVQKSLDDMDKVGGRDLHRLDHHARNLVPRQGRVRSALRATCNEYTAKLMADHPGRFGLFATLPLPRHRRDPEGDRLRLRHAEGRRRLHDDELQQQVARPCRLRAGDGGAQPPQGGALHPSDRRALLRQPGSRDRARRSSNSAPTPRAPSPAWCSPARRRSTGTSASSSRMRAAPCRS